MPHNYFSVVYNSPSGCSCNLCFVRVSFQGSTLVLSCKKVPLRKALPTSYFDICQNRLLKSNFNLHWKLHSLTQSIHTKHCHWRSFPSWVYRKCTTCSAVPAIKRFSFFLNNKKLYQKKSRLKKCKEIVANEIEVNGCCSSINSHSFIKFPAITIKRTRNFQFSVFLTASFPSEEVKIVNITQPMTSDQRPTMQSFTQLITDITLENTIEQLFVIMKNFFERGRLIRD